jgi:hypothetical protein
MSDQDTSMYVPQPSAYGRIIRERGTRRILLLALAFAVVWYIYDQVNTHRLNQVKWPALQSTPTGLVVLGLQDKDRPGWIHRYEARESNRSWQIRYSEEDMGEGAAPAEDPDLPGARDRGDNNPGARRGMSSGAVVPMEELMKECPVVLTGKHFTGASIEEKFEEFRGVPYYAIHLNLSGEGRSRYWQFSNVHDKERLVFILNNEVITCPRIENMYVSSFTIDPIWVKEDAKKLVDFINGQYGK